MTREETIRKVLDTVLWTGNASDDNKRILTNALIKALEQEPTAKENLVVGDCISRVELINKTIKRNSIWLKITDSRGMNLQEIIDELPSIQPKTGYWIEVGLEDFMCSECRMSGNPHESDYCPDCGAKMLPTGSEKE